MCGWWRRIVQTSSLYASNIAWKNLAPNLRNKLKLRQVVRESGCLAQNPMNKLPQVQNEKETTFDTKLAWKNRLLILLGRHLLKKVENLASLGQSAFAAVRWWLGERERENEIMQIEMAVGTEEYDQIWV
jgi:hypothetical protein